MEFTNHHQLLTIILDFIIIPAEDIPGLLMMIWSYF